MKTLLKKKFGECDVAQAVDKLEEKPDAKGRRQTAELRFEFLNIPANSRAIDSQALAGLDEAPLRSDRHERDDPRVARRETGGQGVGAIVQAAANATLRCR